MAKKKAEPQICPECGLSTKHLNRHIRKTHAAENYDRVVHEVVSKTGKKRIVKAHSVLAISGGLPETNRRKH
jgi:hypothetical protein